MLTLTYVQPDGRRVAHHVTSGDTVMQVAISQGEDGIVAECGGQLMCATCHVYVDPAFAERFSAPSQDEDELLTCTAAERRSTSRLSCQLVVTDAVDGLAVEIPPIQI